MQRLLTMLAGLLLAGCTVPGGLATDDDDCPEAAEHGAIHIDWVDFVKVGDRAYHRVHVPEDGQQLEPEQLGERITETRCQLPSDLDEEYEPQDGDAAFLAPGTPLFAVEGFGPGFRMAAMEDEELKLYEVDRVPDAERGADIYGDIDGKVAAINVNSHEDGVTTLGCITDPERVDTLVGMVLEAPVDREAEAPRGVGPHVEFVLEDLPPGTMVLNTDHHLLGINDLRVPDEFVSEIRQAMEGD